MNKKILSAMLCGALVGSVAFIPVSAAADFIQEFGLSSNGFDSVVEVLNGSYTQNMNLVPGASGDFDSGLYDSVDSGSVDILDGSTVVVDSYNEPSSVTEGEKVVLPSGDDLVKPGFKFVGWNTDPNATEGFFEYVMPAENITLFAIWTPEVANDDSNIADDDSNSANDDSSNSVVGSDEENRIDSSDESDEGNGVDRPDEWNGVDRPDESDEWNGVDRPDESDEWNGVDRPDNSDEVGSDEFNAPENSEGILYGSLN